MKRRTGSVRLWAAAFWLDVYKRQLEDVRAKGTYLRNQIEGLDLPCFGATRGMGLMIGIQVKDGWTNKEIASKLIENGLLVLTAGPGMRLLPPLVISQEEMDQGLEILKKTLS